ncbi:MAG: MFS transporter [Planctomycetota bacterium]
MTTTAARPHDTHRFAVLALAGACFAMSLNHQVLAAISTWMKHDLVLDEDGFGAIAGAAGIASGVASLVLGGMVDRFGRRPPLLIGLSLFAVANLGYLIADAFWAWIAVRVATGFVGGVVLTSASSAVADLVPYERRGRAMALVTAAILLAVPIGLPIADRLANGWHWRVVFGLQGIAALVALVALWSALPRGLGKATVRVPMHTVLARREIAAALLSVILYTGAFFAMTQFLAEWLATAKLLPRERHWMVWIALGVFASAGSFMLGPLVDKRGKRSVVLITTLVVAVGIALLGRSGSILVFASLGIPVAIASAARSAALLALISGMVPADSRGALMGLRNAANSLGTGIVTPLAGAIIGASDYPTFLLVAGGLILLAWLLVHRFVPDDAATPTPHG